MKKPPLHFTSQTQLCNNADRTRVIIAQTHSCVYVYDLMITVTFIPREYRYIWEDVSHKLHEEQGMSY